MHRKRRNFKAVQLALTPELLEVVFWIFLIWFVVVGLFIAMGE
jgi:hypothetical protein